MLRNYFMSRSMSIQSAEIEVYQYQLTPKNENNWIPIIIISVPFTKTEVQSDSSIRFTDATGPYKSTTAQDLRLTNTVFPIWAQGGIVFKEVYTDDYFTIYTENHSENAWSGTFSCRSKDGAYYLFNAQSITSDAHSATMPYILGLKTTDNYYYSCGVINPTHPDDTYDIVTDVNSGVTKGSVIYKNSAQFGTGLYITAPSISEPLRKLFEEIIKKSHIYNPNNPYPNTGDDPDDPPAGDFDYTPDPIDVPDLPTTSVTDSGLISLYAPTEAQLKALASFLWSDAFSLDTFKKMFNNPMDCILGLTILPINVPHGSAREITVGNIVSTVSCDTLPTQYTSLDCGTFEFKQSSFTGSYLDFSPYTKCYVYLPFIGCQEIDIDEFMGSTMGVVYHIDILTGALFCYVTRNGSVIYTYAGCCAENVPLSSNDFSTTVGSIMQIGIAAAGAVATIASAGAATPATAAAATALQAKTAAGVTAAGITGASAVMNSKPSVAHSGSLGGGGGMMGVMYPYLIFIAPRASIPSDQNKYTGFPANKIVKISSLSGFNVIEAVNLEVKGANDSEMSEIDQYLKAGVII